MKKYGNGTLEIVISFSSVWNSMVSTWEMLFLKSSIRICVLNKVYIRDILRINQSSPRWWLFYLVLSVCWNLSRNTFRKELQDIFLLSVLHTNSISIMKYHGILSIKFLICSYFTAQYIKQLELISILKKSTVIQDITQLSDICLSSILAICYCTSWFNWISKNFQSLRLEIKYWYS